MSSSHQIFCFATADTVISTSGTATFQIFCLVISIFPELLSQNKTKNVRCRMPFLMASKHWTYSTQYCKLIVLLETGRNSSANWPLVIRIIGHFIIFVLILFIVFPLISSILVCTLLLSSPSLRLRYQSLLFKVHQEMLATILLWTQCNITECRCMEHRRVNEWVSRVLHLTQRIIADFKHQIHIQIFC